MKIIQEQYFADICDMKVKLTKLRESDDPLHPGNIPEGYETTRSLPSSLFKPPTVGERFNLQTFSTSGVQEIINDNTFRTYNSIYKWEIVT